MDVPSEKTLLFAEMGPSYWRSIASGSNGWDTECWVPQTAPSDLPNVLCLTNP
jgi:hypothetical protein